MLGHLGRRHGLGCHLGGCSLELSEYGRAIARGWWIVVACAVVGLLAAWAITINLQPQYQSTVRFFVASPPVAGQSALQSDELSRGRIASYAALVKSDQFLARIMQGSGLDLDEAEALQSVSASSDRDTLLLTVVVTLSDPGQTTAVASAIAANFGPAVNELEVGKTPGTAQTVLRVVSGPTAVGAPVAPRTNLNIGLGMLLGTALGIAAAIARRLLDRSLHTPEQVEAATALPLLARMPRAPAAKTIGTLMEDRPETLLDESGRRLRTNIDHLPSASHLQTVTVTSATAGEGKTTTAALLAKAWADAGHSVLLVEADLRHPRLAQEIGLAKTTGLSNVLSGQLPLAKVIQKTPHDRLYALAAGTVPLRPTELLGSKQMESLLKELKSGFSRIVVDATALQPLSDGALMASLTDASILVVRHEGVTAAVLAVGMDNLRAVDSHVLGVAVNALPGRLTESHPGGARRSRRAHRAHPDTEPGKGTTEPHRIPIPGKGQVLPGRGTPPAGTWPEPADKDPLSHSPVRG